LFKKVDYHYPINFGKVGLDVGAKYYGLLSSTGASSSSWFLYMKTKGEVERDITKIGYQQMNIYRPGLLLNRDNDERIGEKIFSVVPFITKIESASVGLIMLDQAIKYCQSNQTEKKTDIYSNSDMLRYAASI
jgi:uncharacterized protein YbjT (DUF2867 family)